jgi:hypothetical protein
MDYYLKLVTAPALEPLTLEQIKDHLRLDSTDQDLMLGSLIKAARRWTEHFLSRCLIEQTWDLLFTNGFPAFTGWDTGLPAQYVTFGRTGLPFVHCLNEIRIPRAPLKATGGIVSVKYLDATGAQITLVAGTDYVVGARSEPAIIAPAYGKSWPATRNYLDATGNYPAEVRFIAGYGAAGSAVPENFRQAMLLLVGHWFENREEVSGSSLASIPKGVEALLWQDRFIPR